MKMSVPVYTPTCSDFSLFHNFSTFGGVRLMFWPICCARDGHALMLFLSSFSAGVCRVPLYRRVTWAGLEAGQPLDPLAQ